MITRKKTKLTKKMRKRQIIVRTTSAIVLALFCVVGGGILLFKGKEDGGDPKYIPPETQVKSLVPVTMELQEEKEPLQEAPWSYEAHRTEKTQGFADNIISKSGILIEVESGNILAEKGAFDRMNPASMTKILTVLVAAELLEEQQLEESFVMTQEIKDYSYLHDCSDTGFEVGEVIPVRDLFYGTILPSGADAALGLATFTAGSQEAFVEKMNRKLEEMGLSETTHVMNCVGLYDENHYSTPYDMAVIIKAATDNPWCREVLSTHCYTTTPTAEHSEGIIISNWFLRRIEDKDTHGEVLCAKTGYVKESGSCAASLALDYNQKEYICVTAGSTSSWQCIFDQVNLYTKYLPIREKE